MTKEEITKELFSGETKCQTCGMEIKKETTKVVYAFLKVEYYCLECYSKMWKKEN